jgi:hypothetical protein
MSWAKVAGCLTIATLGFAYYRWMIWFADRSTDPALKDWQNGSGYIILAKQFRIWDRGPFCNASSTMQAVYRLDLEDKKGQRRRAWARCGHWLTGPFLKPVEIKIILDDNYHELSPLHE